MRALQNPSPSARGFWLGRAARAVVVAGMVGLTGLTLAPATAEAQYYYGPRPHYRPPPPAYYYRPAPPIYYRPPPPVYYRPPPAYYRPPPVYYRPPPPPGFGIYIR